MYSSDFYKILNIKFPSSQKEIHDAYISLAQKHHPDKGGNSDRMTLINQAYDILSSEVTKSAYDKWYLSTILNVEVPDPRIAKTHILTIENNIKDGVVDTSKLSFDYEKYLHKNELYFFEKREGNRIITIVTDISDWNKRIFQANKITHIDFDANCDKHKSSDNSNGSNDNNKASDKKHNKTLFTAVLIICFILIVSALSQCTQETFAPKPTPTPVITESPKPKPTPTPMPPEPLPEDGQILKYPSVERVAPLTIETVADTLEETLPTEMTHYYIYLEYCGDNRDYDMGFFYMGGENSITVDVPLGKYKFYYCSGHNWYGIDYKFGTDTVYSTSNDILEFYEDDDYVWGHTIELYKRYNGNFDTHNIDADKFPG